MLQQIIACAPFRLPQPRPLTKYETGVVHAALRQGYFDVGRAPIDPEIAALRNAMLTQTHCPRWRTSMFGPAPAVATYAYRCFAAWYAGLDPASKANAIGDIMTKGLLCSPTAPWGGNCPSEQMVGGSAQNLWEGAPQQGGPPGPGDGACAYLRRRTAYMPMTGDQMLELFELASGGLPPALQQAKSYGQPFLSRSFLVGIEARPASLTGLGHSPMAIASALVEDVALIWAPGKGASVRFLLDQPLDPAKLQALIQTMMPDLLPELLPGLPGWIVPPPDDPIWGTLGNLLPGFIPQSASSASQPGTPPRTGLPVVDQPGSSLSSAAPWPGLSSGLRFGWALAAFVATAAAGVALAHR